MFLCGFYYFLEFLVKYGFDLIGKLYIVGGLFELGVMEMLKKLYFLWNLGKWYNVIKGKENLYYNILNFKIDDIIDDCV